MQDLTKSGLSKTTEERWTREAEFFDSEEYSESPLAPATIERYRLCRKPWLVPEYPFWVLGDVKGKRILEVGCGDGNHAILLALKGAHVTGVDISRRAIEVAAKKAAAHGLGEQVKFYCGPIEIFSVSDRFDVIAGSAILHHLLPQLDSFLWQLKRLGKPNAFVIFTEPVSMSRAYRKVRLMLPIRLKGSPDERPLESADLDIVMKHLERPHIQYFDGFARLNKFIVKNGNYEKSSALRRSLCDALGRLDLLVLQRLHFYGLSSNVVITGYLAESN